MNFFITIIVYIFVFFTAIVPFFILYLISDVMGFVMHKLVGYRKAVVIENLQNSFPALKKDELKRLVKLSYRNLTDLMVETLKGFSITTKQILKRHRFINPEVLTQFLASGRSFIVTASHYNNWEWGGLSVPLHVSCNAAVFYKPLASKRMDKILKKNRERSGIEMVSILKTAAYFNKNQNKQTAYFMVADQSPSNLRKSIWINFLGQETAFLHGPELYATTHDLPVLYADINRRKRGYYDIQISVLAENPLELPKGEITRRFAAKLEDVIHKQPENWLWSHKRWKMKKPKNL